MTLPSPLPLDLAQLLRLDFRPADLGDTPEQYQQRLDYTVALAAARPAGITDSQREAGARYLLLSAQIRQVRRQVEELKSASGSSIRQDLATKLASLQAEQAAALKGFGLQPVAQRPGSVSVPVMSEF